MRENIFEIVGDNFDFRSRSPKYKARKMVRSSSIWEFCQRRRKSLFFWVQWSKSQLLYLWRCRIKKSDLFKCGNNSLEAFSQYFGSSPFTVPYLWSLSPIPFFMGSLMIVLRAAVFNVYQRVASEIQSTQNFQVLVFKSSKPQSIDPWNTFIPSWKNVSSICLNLKMISFRVKPPPLEDLNEANYFSKKRFNQLLIFVWLYFISKRCFFRNQFNILQK